MLNKSLRSLFLCCVLYHYESAQFLNRTVDLGFNHSHNHPALMGGGGAFVDANNDGDLDVLLATTKLGGFSRDLAFSYQLYQNRIQNGHNFLQILLEGTTNNRDGFGTSLIAYHNNRAYAKYFYPGGTHASQNAKMIQFGLEQSTIVDSLKIIWPNGIIDWHYNISVNSRIQIIEGESTFEVVGCMDSDATNYNEKATIDAGCMQIVTTSSFEVEKHPPLMIFPIPGKGELSIQNLLPGEYQLRIMNPL